MTMTAAPTGSALAPLVDVLLAEPLAGFDAGALQEQIAALKPQVGRLQGWLTKAAGRLEELTGGGESDPDSGHLRTVAEWLAEVQHSTAGAAGSRPRTARSLRTLPLATAAVLDGLLTPAQAAVLTRLSGKIDEAGWSRRN